MIIKRNINNNVSLCTDSKGQEVVVFGKGIGFIQVGSDVPLAKIERTFYHLDSQYISLLNDISSDSMRISDEVLSYAVQKGICEFNSSLLFSLADHIDYAIRRYKKGIKLSLSIGNDIYHLFDVEMGVGLYALKVIEQRLNIKLPEEEATFIALNIINSENNLTKNRNKRNDMAIEEATQIMEREFNITIDKNRFTYSRFVSHMHYLFKREDVSVDMQSKNKELYMSMVNSFPEIYKCAKLICNYLNSEFGWSLSDDECLYLMIHINRLCNIEETGF